jgi:hypothetical protein
MVNSARFVLLYSVKHQNVTASIGVLTERGIVQVANMSVMPVARYVSSYAMILRKLTISGATSIS